MIIQSIQDPSVYDIGTVSINIDYRNQHTPRFVNSAYKIKLPEAEAITDFLTVVAHDPDLGIYGQVAYKLSGKT